MGPQPHCSSPDDVLGSTSTDDDSDLLDGVVDHDDRLFLPLTASSARTAKALLASGASRQRSGKSVRAVPLDCIVPGRQPVTVLQLAWWSC